MTAYEKEGRGGGARLQLASVEPKAAYLLWRESESKGQRDVPPIEGVQNQWFAHSLFSNRRVFLSLRIPGGGGALGVWTGEMPDRSDREDP